MELEMGLAVLGIVAVTAAAVYLVSVMGIKEKSFEEAIAEQKKRSEDLLGRKESKRKVTVKDKSKKQKRAKEKEKHQIPYAGGDSVDTVDVDEVVPQHHHEVVEKHHVEIDPEPEILDDLTISESRRASVIRMRDSLKSILINKEEQSPVYEQEAEPANHFEDILPKGDLELKKHINYDDSSPPPSPPPLPQRHLKKKREDIPNIPVDGSSSDSNLNVSGHYENVPVVVDDTNDAESLTPEDGPYEGRQFGERGGVRSRKTKRGVEQERDQLTATKVENTIDKVSSRPVAVRYETIEKSIEKVSLSSSEIQNLIDVLLNKQNVGDSEWINKGKNDSVGTLKKQLAERERQLNEEQITVQTLQTKLKELRNEFTSEKSKFSQVRRQLEDTGGQKIQEIQQLQVRLQQLRQEALGEKQTLQQKLQQMQLNLTTLRDENVAVKGALSVEQGNRGKADSLEREAEALRTQCGHLENQLKAAFQSNQELSNQSRNLQEHLRVLEERKKQEEHNIHAQYAQQIQDREAHVLSELKKAQDLLAEGEKERISLRQQNSNLQNSLRNSQETAIALDEVTKKVEELRETEKNTKNLLEDSVSQAASLKNQLQSTESKLQRLEEGRKNLLEQVATLTEKQVAAEKEREKLNGDIKSHAEQETNEAMVDKSKLEQLQILLNEKEGVLEGMSKTNTLLQNEVDKTIQDLKSQKETNDELRVKNTKLMDTLNVTEKNLEARITQCEQLVQEEKVKTREETEKSVGVALQKKFPQFTFSVDTTEWIDNFSKSIQKEIETVKQNAQPISANDSNTSVELKKLEEVNARLQEEVSHYQNVLSSTETLLSNLQGSIEKEERKWHQKLQQKEAELNAVRGQMPSDNTEVTKLKSLLETEREEKSVLLQRCSELENNIQNLKKQIEQNDSLRKALERLEGEVNEERRKGAELSNENLRLESEVIKQQNSCKAEQEKVTQLQLEIDSLKSVGSTSIISSNGVVNGKSVVNDGSSSSPSEPVVKTGGSSPPSASTSSTTTSTAPVPNATTNADASSKESKPKKKKGASAKK